MLFRRWGCFHNGSDSNRILFEKVLNVLIFLFFSMISSHLYIGSLQGDMSLRFRTTASIRRKLSRFFDVHNDFLFLATKWYSAFPFKKLSIFLLGIIGFFHNDETIYRNTTEPLGNTFEKITQCGRPSFLNNLCCIHVFWSFS